MNLRPRAPKARALPLRYTPKLPTVPEDVGSSPPSVPRFPLGHSLVFNRVLPAHAYRPLPLTGSGSYPLPAAEEPIMAYPVLSHFGPANIGAGDRLRTRDLSLTRRLLCHLSYTGKPGGQGRHRTGDLRVTNALLCHLSYSAFWHGGQESNLVSRIWSPTRFRSIPPRETG